MTANGGHMVVTWHPPCPASEFSACADPERLLSTVSMAASPITADAPSLEKPSTNSKLLSHTYVEEEEPRK